MKKKIKLFSTILILCFCVTTLFLGVFSAVTITYNVKGTITYNVDDVFIEVETRIYSTSKKFMDYASLKQQSQVFENMSFEQLDQLTNTGIVEDEVIYTFNKVILTESQTPTEEDYKYSFSTVESSTAPDDLKIDLIYSREKQELSYFVITKITNKSALPTYIYTPTFGEDKYIPAQNSIMYKFEETKKQLKDVNSSINVVFAMSLDDITKEIDEELFVYPIAVTKEEATLKQLNINVQDLGTASILIDDSLTIAENLENAIIYVNNVRITADNITNWFSDEELATQADLSIVAVNGTTLYTKLKS